MPDRDSTAAYRSGGSPESQAGNSRFAGEKAAYRRKAQPAPMRKPLSFLALLRRRFLGG